MKTRLILIRHGLTEWNTRKKYCGSTDIGISRKGKKQARRLKSRLEKERIGSVYSSTKRRAIETAGIIFAHAKIYKMAALREMNFGIFEGLTFSQIMRRYPVVYRKWLANPFETVIPGAELLKDLRKRVTGAIKQIVSARGEQTIAVVCHGGVISVLMTHILKSDNFWKYLPDSASLTTIDFSNKKAKVQAFNDTTHLCRVQKSRNTWREAPKAFKNYG